MGNRLLSMATILATVAILACSSKNGGKTVPEPKNYKAITDTLSVTGHSCGLASLAPMRMFVSQGYLVVANNVKNGHIFNVYSLPLGGKEFSAIDMGRGPEELIRPDFKSMVEEGDGFMVADADNLVKYFKINESNVKQTGSERLFEPGPLNGVIKFGGSFLNFNMEDRSQHPYEFVVVKADGAKEYIGGIPDWDKNVGKTSVAAISSYPNMHISRPKGDRLAEFYCFYRRVRILDVKGNLLSETFINYPTSSERIPLKQGFYCTYGVTPCASDSRIVAMTENNFRKTDPEDVIKPKEYSEFQIWDWEGHLLKRIITKAVINQYTVDFSTGTLYGINRSEENKIYTVDISLYL